MRGFGELLLKVWGLGPRRGPGAEPLVSRQSPEVESFSLHK